MSRRARAWELFLPWAALTLAAFAWFGSHQTGSNLTIADCRSSGGGLAVLLVGLAAVALALVGGLLSRSIWRRGGESEVRRFLALVGMLCAALLGLAIVLQTLAGLIIPSCFA